MYWIYLIIFIAAVLMPIVIRVEVGVLAEEYAEALLILTLGAIGFMVYLAREKQMFRVVSEKLKLQKVTNAIGRDLTDSYSYIGAMNRKYDIVRSMIVDMPTRMSEKEGKWQDVILDTALLLANTKAAGLFFADRKTSVVLASFHRGGETLCRRFTTVDGRYLLEANRTFFVQDECFVARSPRFAHDIGAFLVFPKKVNFFEDADLMKMLAAEALLLYSLHKPAPGKSITQ